MDNKVRNEWTKELYQKRKTDKYADGIRNFLISQLWFDEEKGGKIVYLGMTLSTSLKKRINTLESIKEVYNNFWNSSLYKEIEKDLGAVPYITKTGFQIIIFPGLLEKMIKMDNKQVYEICRKIQKYRFNVYNFLG